jgi:hypothetical protein
LVASLARREDEGGAGRPVEPSASSAAAAHPGAGGADPARPPETNVDATMEAGEPNHAGNAGGASVWYLWTAPATGNAEFDTIGSGFDTLLAVYTGASVDQLTLVAQNDDYTSAKWTSQLGFPAIALTGTGGIVHRSMLGATKEAGEPNHAGNAGGASVWFRWTAPADGQWRFYTTGSSFNTLLAVYTGSSVDKLTLVGSNDDVAATDKSSSVTIVARGNTTYWITTSSDRPAAA